LVLTIAAGKKIESIEAVLGKKTRIGRLVVNTPALVGEMAGAYSLG
jgi:pyrroline-5-carboxylate reductase